MIVQFLNGKQLEIDRDTFGYVYSHILSHQKDLELEITFKDQITIQASETEPDLWYAFITPVTGVEHNMILNEISRNGPKDERKRLLSLYHQKMADECLFTYFFSKNHSYMVYNSAMQRVSCVFYRGNETSLEEFNHPLDENSPPSIPIEEGYRLYTHRVEVWGEEFVISTIVSESCITDD